MRHHLPHWLKNEDCKVLLENWDRFLEIKSKMLAVAADGRNDLSWGTAIEGAVIQVLDEVAWKNELHRRIETWNEELRRQDVEGSKKP